jgi:pentatricopeptide repeat protein
MESTGVKVDVKVYNAFISSCARGGLWEDAWEVVSTMRRLRLWPTVRTYNALISACERAGEPRRAMEVYDRMQRDSGTPDPLPSTFLHHRSVDASGRAGSRGYVVEGSFTRQISPRAKKSRVVEH